MIPLQDLFAHWVVIEGTFPSSIMLDLNHLSMESLSGIMPIDHLLARLLHMLRPAFQLQSRL